MLPPWHRPVAPPRGLWDSTVEDVIRRSAYHAESKRLTRQRQIWKALEDYLEGAHLAYTKAAAGKVFPRRSARWNEAGDAAYRSYPLVEMHSDRLAVTFQSAPWTWLHRGDPADPLAEDHPQVQQWRRDEESIELDAVLPQIDSYVQTLQNAPVMVVWRAGRLRWEVYGPSAVYVHQGDEDPGALELAREIAIELSPATDSVGHQKASSYLVWTRRGTVEAAEWGLEHRAHDGALSRVDPYPVWPDGRNPYGLHPIVIWQRRRTPTGSVFVPPPEPLFQSQLGIDLSLTELEHGARFQAWGQWVEFGNAIESDGEIGPDLKRKYQDKSTEGLENVKPNTDLAQLRDQSEWGLRMLAVSAGLPPDTYSPNSSTRNLGAKEHESSHLQVRRRQGWPYYARALRRTFEITKRVGNYWASQQAARLRYDDDIQLGVELAAIPEVTDRQAESQATQAELERGIVSEVDIVMRREGCSRREAMRRIRQRIVEQREIDALRREGVPPGVPPTDP